MKSYYYRKDTGSLWAKTTDPTARELMHLSCADGLVPWGIIEVDDFLVDHINASHCLVVDGALVMLPESEWPEEVITDGIS